MLLKILNKQYGWFLANIVNSINLKYKFRFCLEPPSKFIVYTCPQQNLGATHLAQVCMWVLRDFSGHQFCRIYFWVSTLDQTWHVLYQSVMLNYTIRYSPKWPFGPQHKFPYWNLTLGQSHKSYFWLIRYYIWYVFLSSTKRLTRRWRGKIDFNLWVFGPNHWLNSWLFQRFSWIWSWIISIWFGWLSSWLHER